MLLDLPDHDSTEVSHHLEVDRLVKLADLLVWVLDPQKYADAAIHDRYLAPLATHRDVMLVVLNHIDTVPEDRREAMLADVRRLLDADGLAGVPVLGDQRPRTATASPSCGRDRRAGGGQEGHPRAARGRRARRREPAPGGQRQRRAADAVHGAGRPRSTTRFADAAGVPTVVDAVERVDPAARQPRHRLAGRRLVLPAQARPAQAAPPRPRRGGQGADRGRARTSVPQATRVQRARVDTEVRAVADEVSRRAAPAVGGRRPPGLGLAAARPRRPARPAPSPTTDLGVERMPVWAGLVRVLQWLLILAALGGLVWLGAPRRSAYLRLTEPVDPRRAAASRSRR